MKNTNISNQTREMVNKSLDKLSAGVELNNCDSLESFASFVAQSSHKMQGTGQEGEDQLLNNIIDAISS